MFVTCPRCSKLTSNTQPACTHCAYAGDFSVPRERPVPLVRGEVVARGHAAITLAGFARIVMCLLILVIGVVGLLIAGYGLAQEATDVFVAGLVLLFICALATAPLAVLNLLVSLTECVILYEEGRNSD